MVHRVFECVRFKRVRGKKKCAKFRKVGYPKRPKPPERMKVCVARKHVPGVGKRCARFRWT